MKKFVLIGLLILILIACGTQQADPASTAAEQQNVVPDEDTTVHDEVPIVSDVTEPPVTLPPAPTPTPEPTPEPTPTPVPTPTPTPFRDDLYARKLKALELDTETFVTVSTKGDSPTIFDRLEDGKRFAPFERIEGVSTHEWIVLGTAGDSKKYYHVRAIGSDAEGYLDVEKTEIISSSTPLLSYRLNKNENRIDIHATPVTIISSSKSIYKNNKKLEGWRSGTPTMFMPGEYMLSDDRGYTKVIKVGSTPMKVQM